ncbi:MAG: adenylate/guanylate cyclase domain-containing protein [Acidimicrobiia bacterium]|nr:adenylate/guanylate cyclase domain-containing protein [Acidimicrobiia bacterium]
MEGGPDLIQAVQRSVKRGLLGANVIGGAITAVYFEATGVPGHHSAVHGAWTDPVLIGFFVVVLRVGYERFHRKTFTGATRWVGADRAPTLEERTATLSLPRVAGRTHGLLWIALAFVGAGANYLTHRAVGLALRILFGISFVAVAVGLLSTLLVERSLRPLFAQLFAGTPPERAVVVGIKRRLLLFWALGSGIPLLGVLLTPLGLPSSDRDRVLVGMLVLAASGLGFGLFFILAAANSVADPVTAVRNAMARMAGGDLDVDVPVDDDGELGLLQAGFNTMASGLRERERLRELFGGYVGDEVARRAVESGVTLEGEERDVSVLFVDVVGSTALAERRPAVEVVGLLNRFFDAVIRTVDSEQGWVNKFEGDATLCVFGAPMDQPDHAARALRAAVALRSALRAIEGLDAGIGISSGIAVAGNVGSERRYEYTVVGDPVNEAARLTELAKAHPGRIVVSEATVTAGGGSGDGWRPGECVTLRGRSRPTQTFVPA